MMTGLKVPRGRPRHNETLYVPDWTERAPAAVDWRKKGYVTPVKNQVSRVLPGVPGAGWHPGVTHGVPTGPVWLVLGFQLGGRAGGAAEAEDGEAALPQPPKPGGLRGQQRRLRRRLHDQRLRVRPAEPRHRLGGCLPLHRPGPGLGGGDKVCISSAPTALPSPSHLGLAGPTQDESCMYSPTGKAAKCRGYREIPEGNEKALKRAVARIGPVSVGIDASLPSFQFYSRGEELRGGEGNPL